jgi:hypothetical protein
MPIGDSLNSTEADHQTSLKSRPSVRFGPSSLYYALTTPGQGAPPEQAGKKTKIMLTLIKIAVAIAIGLAFVNPSSTPKADANCKCSADA